jgi:hypothetical protein
VTLRERLETFDSWRRQLAAELSALPQTLNQLREGVENFRRVTQRLVDSTTGIEQFNDMQSGALSEMRQRVDDANRAVREQLAAVPGGERLVGALEDLTDAMATIARLNPLWSWPYRRDSK